MTPLIISTRRSDATLRAIRSVTMVGNVSTFLTSSIGDPTGTQPTVGLTPRTITDPASFMVGPAGLEPATSSTPRKRATTALRPDGGSADCEGARRNRGSSCDPLTLTLSLQGEGNEVGAPRRLTSGAVR